MNTLTIWHAISTISLTVDSCYTNQRRTKALHLTWDREDVTSICWNSLDLGMVFSDGLDFVFLTS